MSNRSDAEEIILHLFTGYREHPDSAEQITAIVMAALDNKGVFKARKPDPVTTKQSEHVDDGLARCSVEYDEDDCDIFLYCNDCSDTIDYGLNGSSIKTLINMVNDHWKDKHS